MSRMTKARELRRGTLVYLKGGIMPTDTSAMMGGIIGERQRILRDADVGPKRDAALAPVEKKMSDAFDNMTRNLMLEVERTRAQLEEMRPANIQRRVATADTRKAAELAAQIQIASTVPAAELLTLAQQAVAAGNVVAMYAYRQAALKRAAGGESDEALGNLHKVLNAAHEREFNEAVGEFVSAKFELMSARMQGPTFDKEAHLNVNFFPSLLEVYGYPDEDGHHVTLPEKRAQELMFEVGGIDKVADTGTANDGEMFR